MKFFKYLTYSLALMLMVVSCDKNEILYDTEPAPEAEFQLHYFEPVANNASNYIDSVYVNGKKVTCVKGGGNLLPFNAVPSGSVGRFFSAPAGSTKLDLYRKGNLIYSVNINLAKGKQNVIVHDFDKDPIILDNGYPYQHVSGNASASTWGTDSLATIKFVNLMYEETGKPYEGKLQYKWQNPRTKEWENLGNPVAFGEATDRVPVLVVKSVFNSSGYCRINYKIFTEDGKELQHLNSGGKTVNYSDYWNAYIGRSYMHFLSGIRTSKSIRVAVKQWTSL